MREIVFDTETTGLDPADGHRMVEIAGVEMVDQVATGREFHFHFNPERTMPAEAEAVHGLTDDFLADKPLFADMADELLDVLSDATLVAHNAMFDLRFLNFELERAGRKPVASGRIVDTLEMARKRFPGAKHTLDALCTRFGIDRSIRVVHGALIDARLLADVYVELSGGRQIGFELGLQEAVREERVRPFRAAREFTVPEEELERHREFVEKMKQPLWLALKNIIRINRG